MKESNIFLTKPSLMLMEIYNNKIQSVLRLQQKLDLHSSNIYKFKKKMIDRGLLEKGKGFKITKKGEEIINYLNKVYLLSDNGNE